MRLFNNNGSSEKNRNSLAQAYLILIPFINYIFGVFELGYAMITNIAICCFIVLLARKSYHFRYKISLIVYVSVIVVFYYISFNSTLEMNRFIFYFIFATFIGTGTFECEKTLRYITYTSLLVLPFWRELFLSDASVMYTNESVSMSVSYALLPMIVAGLLHFVYFRNKANVVLKACYVLDIVILIQILLRANRGAVISLCITVILIYIKGNAKYNISNASIVKIAIISIICFFAIMNIDTVLEGFSNLLKNFGYSVNFIEKTERLSNDVTNGRNEIYQYTIENFFKSPLWGHGICTIYYNSGGAYIYPHNLFLQMLYDGGVILFAIMIVPLIKVIKDIFNKKDRERSIYSLFLFLICVPKMLFTSDMWSNAAFFMMLSYAYTYISDSSEERQSVGE